ncbi:uncharacterized protein LOC114525183 [Dendronephthya gigantea]|uniref:uncharacterized protein LOC114525183 n=1 Tax=Dendronephthya gigantea TaxID=151771 RepID=UPI00106AA6C0|nr:uncharacterized protein LOC114525183 [Dendronephthya gigantea]
MGNLPVIHEVSTSFLSLGDAIVGDPEMARQRWHDYASESIVGSYVAGTVEAIKGNEEKSREYLKGMGRATGKTLLGGGVLRDVPVFHELAVCGDSLGDMIGGGDDESARKRWKTYSESSVIGSGLRSLAAKIDGNDKEAERLAECCGKASARFGVTAVSVGAAVATGGLAAPLGTSVAVASGAVVGGATGAGSTAAVQLINDEYDPGAIVGMTLLGAVCGAESGAKAAKKAKAAKTAKANTEQSQNASSSSSCRENSESSNPLSGKQAPGDPSPPPPGSHTTTNKNNRRPRSHSYSVYQESEHFTPDNAKNVHKMTGKKTFSHKSGSAQRDSKRPDIWNPKDPKSIHDRKAAAKAAKQDAVNSVKDLSNKKRPRVVTVAQDLESGSATASTSIRGKTPQRDFSNKMGWQHKKILDVIDPELRGKGHGWCGEQVAHNNTLAYERLSNDIFQTRGKVSMTAYAETKKGYKKVPPCSTCAQVPGKIWRRNSGP